MISDEDLMSIINNPYEHSTRSVRMAKEIVAHRPCQHSWNFLRLAEGNGRYQYCTLCGAKKVAD